MLYGGRGVKKNFNGESVLYGYGVSAGSSLQIQAKGHAKQRGHIIF